MSDPAPVLGLDLASTSPLFLILLGLHVLAALSAIVSGIAAMVARKADARHGRAGRIYLLALILVLLTACGLSAFRWPADAPLVLLGGAAVLAASYGYAYRRLRRPGNAPHVVAMGASFVLMLTAFYVDNGPRLPLWQLLPAWTFWVLPAAVGTPLIAWAATRHRRPRNPGGRPRTRRSARRS